jgi:hypothetical protein
MKKIQEVEEEFYEDDSHASSFHPFALKDDEDELDISQGQLPTRPSDLAPRISDLGSQERTPISTKRRRFPLFRKKTVPLPRDVDDIDDLLKPSWDGYFPCHYFDYIGGTSTGGYGQHRQNRLLQVQTLNVVQIECNNAGPPQNGCESMHRQLPKHGHKHLFFSPESNQRLATCKTRQ